MDFEVSHGRSSIEIRVASWVVGVDYVYRDFWLKGRETWTLLQSRIHDLMVGTPTIDNTVAATVGGGGGLVALLLLEQLFFTINDSMSYFLESLIYCSNTIF